MSTLATITTKSPAYVAARSKLGDHRKVFDSVGEALATLKAIYATEGFPQAFPVVGAQIGLIDVTGDDSVPPLADWPEEYRTDGVLICVTLIGTRDAKDDSGKTVNGARGFALYPLHPFDAIRADESGEAWLWKVVEKEASHVALRGLRNVASELGTDALAAAAMIMPVSVAGYLEESTRESLDTSAFDAIWKTFRKMLAEQASTAALVPQLPTKSEVLKAVRSESYAKAEYEALETMGAFRFIGETMASIIDSLKAQAIAAGEDFDMDSSEIRDWLAGRATKVFAVARKVETDLSTVDFAAFATGIAAAPAGESTESGDGE